MIGRSDVSMFASARSGVTYSAGRAFSFPVRVRAVSGASFRVIARVLSKRARLMDPVSFSIGGSLKCSTITNSIFCVGPGAHSGERRGCGSVVGRMSNSYVAKI